MSGYYNYSMSNNAVEAYENGEKPWSKWTKGDILRAVSRWVRDGGELGCDFKLLSKTKAETLRRGLLSCTSWHHTSKFFNTTDFFSLEPTRLVELTDEKVRDWQDCDKAEAKSEKNVKKEPQRRKGTIHFLEWGGTRAHPKATKRCLEGVEIEERGCFYYVFQNNRQVLKKKWDSNGTWVDYD